jgi:hypothetical protein
LRIGINLGDVIREADGDLYGDGVNIAARLEQLAEPGGVVVSGTAYDQLHGKLDLTLDFAGEQRVENIERLVRAYRVRLDGTGGLVQSALRRARRFGAAGGRCPAAAAPIAASPQRAANARRRTTWPRAPSARTPPPGTRGGASRGGVTAARPRRSRSRPRFQRRAAPLPVPDPGSRRGPSCLAAERCWDLGRWAVEEYAWRFDGLERASRAGGAA